MLLAEISGGAASVLMTVTIMSLGVAFMVLATRARMIDDDNTLYISLSRFETTMRTSHKEASEYMAQRTLKLVDVLSERIAQLEAKIDRLTETMGVNADDTEA